MYIQVSKVFAKFINETAKIRGFAARAEVVEVTENFYKWHVDIFGPKSDRDYNWQTGKYKVIAVVYPGDYFAPVRYLSTDELITEARAAHVDSIESARDMLQDLLSI
jgi:hypothetical protein